MGTESERRARAIAAAQPRERGTTSARIRNAVELARAAGRKKKNRDRR